MFCSANNLLCCHLLYNVMLKPKDNSERMLWHKLSVAWYILRTLNYSTGFSFTFKTR